MLVRKSGRVQLILGQVTLDVSLGTTCSFLQVWYLWVFFMFLLETWRKHVCACHVFFIPSSLRFTGAGLCRYRWKNGLPLCSGQCQTQDCLFPRFWGSVGEKCLIPFTRLRRSEPLSTEWVLILCCYYGRTSFARSMAFDCVVFRVAIKTIHPLNNMNLFSYCSWDILKFECCAKSKYCLKFHRRLYMDVNVWIIKLLSKCVGVRTFT